MRHRALQAAALLDGDGISAEVIDPRTLVPFDMSTVVESLGRTSRLLVVQEGPPAGGWGSTLISQVVTEHFELLDAPPALLSGNATPVPYAAPMEDAWLPDAARIRAEVIRVVRY
jgi:pyruvate dehydrogenase E1 component beta subunit